MPPPATPSPREASAPRADLWPAGSARRQDHAAAPGPPLRYPAVDAPADPRPAPESRRRWPVRRPRDLGGRGIPGRAAPGMPPHPARPARESGTARPSGRSAAPRIPPPAGPAGTAASGRVVSSSKEQAAPPRRQGRGGRGAGGTSASPLAEPEMMYDTRGGKRTSKGELGRGKARGGAGISRPACGRRLEGGAIAAPAGRSPGRRT